MTRRSPNTNADQLHFSHTIIANSLDSIEIQELMSQRGYPTAALIHGQRLYDLAVQAGAVQTIKQSARQATTERAHQARRAARKSYMELAKTVRALYLAGSVERMALGVTGPTPKSAAKFLSAALTLYTNALNQGAIGQALAAHGFDTAKLERGLALTAEYQQMVRAQLAAASAAVQATSNRNEALAALQKWTARYVEIAKIAMEDRPDLAGTLGIAQRKAAAAAPTQAQAA